MLTLFQRIAEFGVIPVVTLPGPEHAGPLAHALCKGGLPCAEITFRRRGAAEAIRRMKQERPDMLVGAGTVLTGEQAYAAAEAGADFAVAPGCDAEVLKACTGLGLALIPGCCTPSELNLAVVHGCRVVKLFPVELFGGPRLVQALTGPYPHLHFMPTGGVRADNLAAYLALPAVIACGGSWMVPEKALADKRYDEVERLVGEAVRQVSSLRPKGAFQIELEESM